MKLVNAQRMQQLHPATFAAPSYRRILEADIGDYIKVCNGRERFWLEITGIERLRDGRRRFTGRLVNHLVYGRTRYGQTVAASEQHVYDILRRTAA